MTRPALASPSTSRSARWTPGTKPRPFGRGEAAYLMKATVADAVVPVARPPVKTLLDEVVAQRVPIFV